MTLFQINYNVKEFEPHSYKPYAIDLPVILQLQTSYLIVTMRVLVMYVAGLSSCDLLYMGLL